MDAATDRLERRARARFDSHVESVRTGNILARDKRQYERWKRSRPAASASGGNRGTGRGLTGDALERAVMAVAAVTPEYVTIGE